MLEGYAARHVRLGVKDDRCSPMRSSHRSRDKLRRRYGKGRRGPVCQSSSWLQMRLHQAAAIVSISATVTIWMPACSAKTSKSWSPVTMKSARAATAHARTASSSASRDTGAGSRLVATTVARRRYRASICRTELPVIATWEANRCLCKTSVSSDRSSRLVNSRSSRSPASSRIDPGLPRQRNA